MAKATGDRRMLRGGILSAIFSDPFRKLAAIALAILLWEYLDSMVTAQTTVHLRIVESDTAQPRSTTMPDHLQIRIGKREHSVVECLDPSGEEIVEGVILTLEGPRHLIETADENPGFWVLPRVRSGVSNDPEIDVDDIFAINSTYQPLIKSMVPSSVIVRLARNDSQVLPVTKESISVTPPPDFPGFEERLMWESVDFTADSVTLYGPQEAVDALMNKQIVFGFKPQAPDAGSNFVRAELSLLDPTGTVSMECGGELDQLTMTIHLRRLFQEFPLEGVPIKLIGDEALLERVRPLQESENLTIIALNNLEGLLLNLREAEQRADWVTRNTILLAKVTELPDDQNPNVVVTSYFTILDNAFVVDRDYRMVGSPPAVTIVNK